MPLFSRLVRLDLLTRGTPFGCAQVNTFEGHQSINHGDLDDDDYDGVFNDIQPGRRELIEERRA